MRLDLQGHETQNVFVDTHLAFHFGNGCGFSFDIDECEMRLAILR